MYFYSSQYTSQVGSSSSPDTLSKEVGVRTECFNLSYNQVEEKISLLPSLCSLLSQGGIRQGQFFSLNYQSSSRSEINVQPYHVCCVSAGKVVSSSDPFHVIHGYRSQHPATWLVENNLRRQKVEWPVNPDWSSSADLLYLILTLTPPTPTPFKKIMLNHT